MKAQHGAPHASVNPRLNRADEAACETQKTGRKLPNEELKAAVEGLSLTTKIGRKTFVARKLYQGVPARLVMQATGHQTESAFNHYVEVSELKLVAEFMRRSAHRWAA